MSRPFIHIVYIERVCIDPLVRFSLMHELIHNLNYTHTGVSCEKRSVPENGAIQYMNDGSFALYMCNNGYSLSGSNFRECRPNGRCAGREPTCSEWNCFMHSLLSI